MNAKAQIGPLGLLMLVIVVLVVIFMIPGILSFFEWVLTPGPVIGPIGIFFIAVFVILFLRRQVR